MRFRNLIIAAAVAASTVAGGALPAQAAPAASTPNVHWLVTPGHFGPFKLGETLAQAKKVNHLDYKKMLKGYVKAAATQRVCEMGFTSPLLKAGTGDSHTTPASVLYAVLELPCASKIMTVAAYEKKFHPYTKLKIMGFMADPTTPALLKKARTQLPHTSKISFGDSYAKVMKAYKGQLRNYTYLETYNGRTTRTGFISVFQTAHGKAISKKPTYNFYMGGGRVIEMSIGADMTGA